MASQPPQEHGEQPTTFHPASPVPAPSERPPVEPDIDDADPTPPDTPATEPVWPTNPAD